MSEKRDTKKAMAKFPGGFSTGTGLQLWLVFLFCFYFLGYPVPLSILLGAAGGIAAGWVIGWWKTNDAPRDLEPEEIEDSEELPTKVSGLRLAKQKRDARTRKRAQRPQLSFSNFFRR
jgi:hypothetical protein